MKNEGRAEKTEDICQRVYIPPVSLPRAAAHWFSATAEAEPPEDPPGILRISQGLRVVRKAEFSVVLPMPNSSRLVFPSTMPPAAYTF